MRSSASILSAHPESAAEIPCPDNGRWRQIMDGAATPAYTAWVKPAAAVWTVRGRPMSHAQAWPPRSPFFSGSEPIFTLKGAVLQQGVRSSSSGVW